MFLILDQRTDSSSPGETGVLSIKYCLSSVTEMVTCCLFIFGPHRRGEGKLDNIRIGQGGYDQEKKQEEEHYIVQRRSADFRFKMFCPSQIHIRVVFRNSLTSFAVLW